MVEPGELSQRERMIAGLPYRPDDPELMMAAIRAHRLCEQYNAAGLRELDRQELLGELCGRLGRDVTVRAPLQVDYGSNLELGDRVFVNTGLVALDCAPIVIGNDTMLGPNVQLLTPTHPFDPAERRSGVESAAAITIGHDVWIGGGAIVLPGVRVGDEAVVGAGSVVTKDVAPRTVVAGNPARVIRQL